ncbi:hypothetical protein [Amycolatopsis suaedae]|uniref:TraB/GumN family protein n=1 Tax=Amycolatopsis suaedae TaxID=2510978 RepID=A0A4Q7J2N4_9PSEU|nr:hypothetical protein [Amycolatopsis suaedae]RZQ61710.1 hypothetical protein EWH70_22395 [Amycolatopsis suaedae]
MQIVDVSTLWVRVVVTRMRRAGTPLEFVLFPMLHVGEARYYAEIRRRIAECDVVVAEGMPRSAQTALLTAVYRVMRFKRGLVVQNLRLAELDIPLVRPDMTAGQLRESWRRVPWTSRVLMWSLIPVAALLVLLTGTRATMARHAAVDDDTIVDEAGELPPGMEELVVDERDRLLVDALFTLHERRSAEPLRVAVVYGAGHMPAVVGALMKRYRYVPRDAEYVTAFSL